ncbi:ligand-binding sensor domain-containing protein [Treponema brennaborense]|nr:two-component regulator propeller domain-containing protein [Treponema brennaborense]
MNGNVSWMRSRMSYFRTMCFFALCVFCSSFLPAADMHSMQFYQVADKLPSMAVSAIAQDSSGAMYFGTRGSGLVKFDGNSYTPYLREPFSQDVSIPSVVQCMLMDNDVLFLGTYAGVFRFDTKTGSCRNYKICNDVVCCFLRDSKGRLWAGTLDGLALLDDVTGESVTFSNRDPIRTIGNNTVRGLYEDTSGRIFACTYDGIFQYDESGGSFVRPDFIRDANPAAHNVVYALEEDPAGNFWASSWGTGLVKIDSVTGDFTVYPLPNNAIYCMSTRYVDGAVLAGTWGGGLHLLYPDTGLVSSYTTDLSAPYALPNDTIYSMYKDRLGLLWIGTNGGGIVTYDKNRSFLQPVRFDSLSERSARLSIHCITPDENGNLWVILKNKGVLYYEPKSGVLKEYSPENGNLKSGIAYCVYIAPDGNVYLGTDCGLFSYDKQSDAFESVAWYAPFLKKPESRMVYDILQTSDGEFWIGTYGAGLVTYDLAGKKYRRYVSDDGDAHSLSSNVIYFVAEDSRGTLWVGTNAGLNRYTAEKDTFQQYVYDAKNTSGIGGLQIISFYESQDGTLWFSSNDSGVTAMNPETETFATYAHASGLPSNIVAGMVEISPDMFWIATGNGLVLFDRTTGSMQVYTTADGLPSNQFSAEPVVFADGTVWFGRRAAWCFCLRKVICCAAAVPAKRARVRF